MASASRPTEPSGSSPTPRSRSRGARPPAPPFQWADPGDATYDRVALAPGVVLHRWRVDDLGNSSYLLHVEGSSTAAVVDPWRDIDPYLPVLHRLDLDRLLALETHVHNDFVSGGRELAAVMGATLGAAAEAPLRFPFRPLSDNEEIPLGRYRLQVWSTPGHTPEHVSYVLLGPGRAPVALFSGGSLLVGAAGRTDILGARWARPLAIQMYHTLHDRIARLPDTTVVFPTHGGGSFCGRGGGAGESTTIGQERTSNPLLRAPTIEDFLSEILDQRPFPRYFSRMREVNLQGAPLRGSTALRVAALRLGAFDAARAAGAQTLDLRPFVEYDAAHIPGAFAIDFECGAFSAWAGWLLSPERGIVLVDAPDGRASSAAARQLFRIGFDRVLGTLAGGLETWSLERRPTASVRRMGSRALVRAVRSPSLLTILDVRERHEYAAGHLPGALSIPLGELLGRVGEIPRGAPVAVYCAHGYRSVSALSLLEQQGFTELIHADEGFVGWQSAIRPS